MNWFRKWRQRKTMALLALRSGFFGEFAPSVFHKPAQGLEFGTSTEQDDIRVLEAANRYLRQHLRDKRLTLEEQISLEAEIANNDQEIWKLRRRRVLKRDRVKVNYPCGPGPEHFRNFRRARQERLKRQERLSFVQVVALWLLAKCLRMVLR